MANNVQITPGTGDTVAAEEISSAKYQKVKLIDPTAASTTGHGIASNPFYTYTAGAPGCGDGRKTCAIAGTREQFSSQACRYVIITGEENNTDAVVIGGSTVVAAATGGGTTRTGIPIFPLQSVRLEVSNLNLLYIDAVTSTDGVTYAYFT